MIEQTKMKTIVDWLNLNGHYAERINSGTIPVEGKHRTHRIRMASKGTADIQACINGHFVAIEVKKDQSEVDRWLKVVEKLEETGEIAKSNHTIDAQNAHRIRIERAKGKYCLAHSTQCVERFLKFYKII